MHDVILNVFDVNVSEKQIEKLIVELCSDWDCIVDTMGETDFINYICKHFINAKVPCYGDSQEYKDKFWKAIEDIKSKFIEFISNTK